MEKELEVLEEGVGNATETVRRGPSKGVIIGVTAAAIGLLVVFRKKIRARAEKRMVKKLTKKGYTVYEPIQDKDFDEVLDPVE